MTDIGDTIRFGNPLVDPTTGQALASPPSAFTIGGAATDPTAVTLTVQKPDGTQLVYGYPSAGADGTLVRESAGRYYVDISITQAGKWLWRLRGTGAVATAVESSLRVDRQKVI